MCATAAAAYMGYFILPLVGIALELCIPFHHFTAADLSALTDKHPSPPKPAWRQERLGGLCSVRVSEYIISFRSNL